MKMERAFPPSTQLTSPLMIGEQGVFILSDASKAKLSEETRKELEALAYEAISSHLKGAGYVDDKILQDAFEEANARLQTAAPSTPVSLLCVVKEEGASHCLVASAGGVKLLRVDGQQVELAISPSKKGKKGADVEALGIKNDPKVYLAKVELGVDEVLLAFTEEAYSNENWKTLLAGQETLGEIVAKALEKKKAGAFCWILYPHEDSAPSIPPKRKGLTFSVSLILLACLAILGTSVWMKERRTLLGRATPPAAHLSDALVRQETPKIVQNASFEEESDWDFAAQELEIAQLRDAVQEAAEVGAGENELLKQMIAAQEEKIGQMADKEALLTQKLHSQEEYVNLLQSSLALLKEEPGTPSNTLSLQLSEAIESKEMLERELHAIAAHTEMLNQHREEVSNLRAEATEYQETQIAYEEALQLLATQSEELAEFENRFADEELTLHKVREELSGKTGELEELLTSLASAEAAKEALQSSLEEEKRTAMLTQDQFLALVAKSEVQEQELRTLQEKIHILTASSEKLEEISGECQTLASRIQQLTDEKAMIQGDSESLQALLLDQEKALTEREGSCLELAQKLEFTSEALAMKEKMLEEKEAFLAALQISDQEYALKLEETEGARMVLTQQINELTDSHRLLHTEKRNLETQTEQMTKELREKERRLAMIELDYQKVKDAQMMAEETQKVLHKENSELNQKIAALEQVKQDYAKEHLMRRESDEMLSRLATNIQGWKEAVNSMEESRKALAEELAELKSYQASAIKGKVQKAAETRAEKKPSVTRIHLVSPGETLEGIARRYYGTTRKADEIREANEDLLSDGKQVRVGTALVIP